MQMLVKRMIPTEALKDREGQSMIVVLAVLHSVDHEQLSSFAPKNSPSMIIARNHALTCFAAQGEPGRMIQ